MNTSLEEQPPYQKTNPRSAYIAFLFSLVLPGLAQVYNGQIIKGAIYFTLILLIPVIFGMTRGATIFYGYVMLLSILLILRIVILVDGVKNANRQKKYILKRYNTWYFHLLIALLMGTILWFYDSKSILGILAFNIPTPSNQPTIQIGDRIIADMQAYKNESPAYGHIVLFKNGDGQNYAFRVIGLPNDTLELNDNIVTINGIRSKTIFIKEDTIDESEVMEFEEELPDGQKHRIYKSKQPIDSTRKSFEKIIVPANSYYLLGDNRDNAADSRYLGFIDKNKIMGRIIYSYWGNSSDRINVNFLKN